MGTNNYNYMINFFIFVLRWKQFDLSIQKICNGDLERQFQFAIWHYEK